MVAAQVLPVDEHGLIRRAAALRAGWSDAMLAAAVKNGRLLHLAPGVYVYNDDAFDTVRGRDELYRLRGIATITGERATGAVVLSHQSAAAVHGIDLLKPDQSAVHVTRNGSNGGGRRGDRLVHAAALAEEDVDVVDGIRVTGLARTAVDVACSEVTFAQALTVFDMALAKGVARGDLADLLARRRTRGARLARPSLELATALSESVGESWSRAQMIEAGLIRPRLQCAHRVEGRVYRSDFDWDCRLVGEFDGRTKYGRLRRPGEAVTDAVLREKDREDRLRAAGIMVVRWVWADLESGSMVPRVQKWLDRLDRLPRL